MNILVTGAHGFIGKNLIFQLKNLNGNNILQFTSSDGDEKLREYCAVCDFVFHLAGVNRPKEERDFDSGNAMLTQRLAEYLEAGSRCPVLFTSSIQATMNNPYGESKRKAEKILKAYSETTGAPVYIYRLHNVFGKWCRPNYNSVIATFCYNIANDIPIYITDEEKILQLVYIDDVISEFLQVLSGNESEPKDYYFVSEVYTERLGQIAQMLREFSQCTKDLVIPDQSDMFTKKLYSSYLSYLPPTKLQYLLATHSDARGAFAEFIRTGERGQISINITKPHAVKGNHWHHTKHEIFLTVYGSGVVRLRRVDENIVTEVFVNGDELKPVIIPPGYTHMLENLGETDLVTVMWANELFDPEKPDTFYLNV